MELFLRKSIFALFPLAECLVGRLLPSSNLRFFSFLGPFEIKAFKTLMSEIKSSHFGCIAILPRLTNLSVVINDLFKENIEQYLHHKVSVVDKNLTEAHIL